MIGDHRPPNRRLLPLVCLALSLGLFFAGLWPFRFLTANNVRWIVGEPGLRFDIIGIVSGMEPLFAPGSPVDLALPFTIRMEVRPREEPSGSLPRILSAYDGDGRELFFLGQWRASLVLRIFEGERLYRLKYRETGADGLQKDATRSIVVRSDSNALTVFVDGVPARTRSGVNFSLLSNKRVPAWMILGNSPTGESPWRGDLLSLSIYPKALSPGDIESREIPPALHYGFSEGTGAVCRCGADSRYDLVLPSFFEAPKKGLLVPPWRVQKFDRSFWKDVFVNILGFIPFGFAVYAWLRKNGERKGAAAMSIALLLGAGISLFIELLQVYLPTRDSSLTDVMNNVLGTYIGARLFQAARDILYR
jgi:VanZ family protein